MGAVVDSQAIGGEAASESGREVLEPELPIVDAHHHLSPDAHAVRELAGDLAAGHQVIKTVYVECSLQYRTTGPAHLRCVGETEWVIQNTAGIGTCDGIVGFADMYMGRDVGEVLDTHIEVAGRRFKGVRHAVAWDADSRVKNASRNAPRHALKDPVFQSGIEQLAARGLVYETWLYFPQLPDVVALGQAVPDATIVLDHMGGPVTIGQYSDRPVEVFESWRGELAEVARVPNVVIKLGGIGSRAFSNVDSLVHRSAADVAAEWSEHILVCIDLFGPDRCMFESNFPGDSGLCDYVTLWNAYKLITADQPVAYRSALFCDTAERVYRLAQS